MTVLCLMIPACFSPGLSHEQNMAKMRLLTFMGMAVEFKEISFDTMQQELQIGADDVEAFVIDGTSTSPHINLSCLSVLSMLQATRD